MLLHEYILSDQPDGSYEWEMRISSRVALLWSEGREGTCEIHADGVDETASEDVRVGRMHWSDFANVEAPGWRMLSSLPVMPQLAHAVLHVSRAVSSCARACYGIRKFKYTVRLTCF